MRTAAALLSLLVLTSMLATAAPVEPAGGATALDAGAEEAGAAPVVTVRNSTNYLTPPESISRSTVTTASLNVGAAVAVSSDDLATRFGTIAFLERFERADTDEDRAAVVRQTIVALENRSATLLAQQRLAVDRYRRGTSSARTLVREFAEIGAAASQVEELKTTIRDQVDSTVGFNPQQSLLNRLTNVSAGTEPLRSPIRTRLADYLDRPTGLPVSVGVAGDSFVLAIVEAGTYQREAFIGEFYAANGTNQFENQSDEPVSVAFDRVLQLYPWADDHLVSNPGLSSYGPAPLYRVTLPTEHGDVVTSISAVSGEVYREYQRKPLDRLPTAPVATNETAALELTLNGTHDTGPARVEVSTATVGTPVDARITVDGTYVGSTGEDGHLWIAEPAGLFQVNATTADGDRITLGTYGA